MSDDFVYKLNGLLQLQLFGMHHQDQQIHQKHLILVFVVVNLIDNILVQPLVLARAAKLHPLVVIFLVLTGSKIGGIFGMLVAVPIASLSQVVLIILYNELKKPVRPAFSEYVDVQ